MRVVTVARAVFDEVVCGFARLTIAQVALVGLATAILASVMLANVLAFAVAFEACS